MIIGQMFDSPSWEAELDTLKAVNPDWTRDEMIVALDFYLLEGKSPREEVY